MLIIHPTALDCYGKTGKKFSLPLIVVFISTLSSRLCSATSNSAGVKGDW